MKRGRENARAASASVLYSLLPASWQLVNDEQIKRRNQLCGVPLRLSASYSCTDICAHTPSLGVGGRVPFTYWGFGVHVKQRADVSVSGCDTATLILRRESRSE